MLGYFTYNKKVVANPRKRFVRRSVLVVSALLILAASGYGILNYNAIERQTNFDKKQNISTFVQDKIDSKVTTTTDTNKTVFTNPAVVSSGNKLFKTSDYYIELPSLGITGNIIETDRMDKVHALLDKGIVHIPGSKNVGEKGNTILLGHSSSYNYGYYANIFATLNKLENDDLVIVYRGMTSYVFKVVDREIISPRLEEINALQGQEMLVLLTCWPIGTDTQRLAVYAQRVK